MFQRYKSIFKRSRFSKVDTILEESLSVSIREVRDECFFDALKWHGAFRDFSHTRKYYNIVGKILLNESITHEFDYKGGMIIFSTDVNAVIDSKNFISSIKGFFKSKIETVINRLKRHGKLFDVLKDFEVVKAYSVGNLFRGKYFDRKVSAR